jgi:hypothetical protein
MLARVIPTTPAAVVTMPVLASARRKASRAVFGKLQRFHRTGWCGLRSVSSNCSKASIIPYTASTRRLARKICRPWGTYQKRSEAATHARAREGVKPVKASAQRRDRPATRLSKVRELAELSLGAGREDDGFGFSGHKRGTSEQNITVADQFLFLR